MLTEEVLVQKFITISQERCAKLGDLLQYCHVELVNSYWGCPAKMIQHFVVYSPNVLFTLVDTYKDTLRATAKDIGISDVICMNATRIIRDPASRLKERNPILWLELHWVAVPTKKSSWHPNQD